MRGKYSAVLMGLLTLVYVGLLANTGWKLVLLESPTAKLMGALILVFPLVALWLTVVEFRFGFQIEKLSKQIEAQGNWPQLDFELRPSGRPTKDSAAKVFEQVSKKVATDEGSYLNWFALGLAYDASGDRRRARAAMRRALKLSRG
jgi:cytochrome c-type biogenesis protein CcmH/NrfG